MSAARRVWYLLLDSVTGMPYKGTSASSVTLPFDHLVDDFRKAVYAENSSILTGYSSSQLIVYQNKASFDNVKNGTGDAEEVVDQPLEEDAIITVQFGMSKNKAVAVVVPPPTSSGLFTPCETPFFKFIRQATEQDGWIHFGQDIPSTTLTKLCIRESYRTIASTIQSGINKAIVTGTPGIGKTLFLFYLLWNLVQEEKRVLFIYESDVVYFDGKGGILDCTLTSLPRQCDRSFWNNHLWCLFDAKGKNESNLCALPYGRCRFILSTSPRREMINEFKKPPEPRIFYMPIWSKMELEAIAPLFPSVAEWRDRFKILGGIPRHVLEVTSQIPTKILELASKKCPLDEYIKIVGSESMISEKSNIMHSLVHITSSPPFTESSVCFASQTALDIIVREGGNDARRMMRTLLESCQGYPLTGAISGYIFELYAIELLERGGTFTCRRLAHGNNRTRPEEMVLTIPRSTKKVADEILRNQTRNQLYVPRSSNFIAVDAWIPGIGAFQMSVSKSHDIKGNIEDNLEKLGTRRSSAPLYWLLLPSNYHTFTKKKPQEVEQYAVLIPYPPHIVEP